MSSYLGLPASVVNTLGVLARGVTVVPTSTAAVAVFTPPSTGAVVTGVVLRSPNVALNATTSFKLGTTGVLNNLLGTTFATSMATNGAQYAAALATPSVANTATVYFSFVQTDPIATTMLVDVLGYLP